MQKKSPAMIPGDFFRHRAHHRSAAYFYQYTPAPARLTRAPGLSF
jgi:hypothetical protein